MRLWLQATILLGLPWSLAAQVLPSSPGCVYKPEQFGVSHAQMAGFVPLKDGTHAPVAALIYIKALPSEAGHVKLRAMAWFHDTKNLTRNKAFDKFTLNIFTPVRFLENATEPPVFWLHPSGLGGKTEGSSTELRIVLPETVSDFHEELNKDGLVYKVQGGSYSTTLPFTLFGTMNDGNPLDQPHKQYLYKLCISDWVQCALIPIKDMVRNAARLQRHAQDLKFPSVLTLIKPVFGMPFNLVAELLYYNTMHHARLGINGTLVYDRGGLVDQYQDHSDLAPLLVRHQLMFMMWTQNDVAPPFPAMNASWELYDQQVMYSHAALSFWGQNTYLFLIDLDEFLKVPQGVTLSSLMAPGGCLHGMAYIQLGRINYHCQPGGMDSPTGHARRFLPLLTCSKTADWGWFDYPKCLVLADSVATFLVHDGFVLPDYVNRSILPNQQCVGLAHLENLVSPWRDHNFPKEAVENHKVVHDDSWMWPLREVKEQLSHRANGDHLVKIRPLGGRETWPSEERKHMYHQRVN